MVPVPFGASVNMIDQASLKQKRMWNQPQRQEVTVLSNKTSLLVPALFGNGFSLDMRYSNLTSDGYIRNGWCKHQSFFSTLDKRFKHSNVAHQLHLRQGTYTGITWGGITRRSDEAKIRRYNSAGEIMDGIYYDNESDNYRQHHIQAFYTQDIGQ